MDGIGPDVPEDNSTMILDRTDCDIKKVPGNGKIRHCLSVGLMGAEVPSKLQPVLE